MLPNYPFYLNNKFNTPLLDKMFFSVSRKEGTLSEFPHSPPLLSSSLSLGNLSD